MKFYDVKKRSKLQDLIHIRLGHKYFRLFAPQPTSGKCLPRCEIGLLVRKDHKQALVGAFSSKCEILQSPIDTLYSKESPVQD